MGMYESAQRINKDLADLFNSMPIEEFSARQRIEIINIMLRFGAVAKFRCRSNVAYENFVNACFDKIARFDKVEVKPEFKALQAVEMVEVV